MPYTDQQIETALEEFFISTSSRGTTNRTAMRAALATLDAPDPGLCHWTPADGPLADALKDLPDGWPVTINGEFGTLHCAIDDDRDLKFVIAAEEHWAFLSQDGNGDDITSASWQAPAPAWATPRLPLVVASKNGITAYLGTDDLYRWSVGGASYCPDELEAFWAPITVLIDADGHHVVTTHTH